MQLVSRGTRQCTISDRPEGSTWNTDLVASGDENLFHVEQRCPLIRFATCFTWNSGVTALVPGVSRQGPSKLQVFHVERNMKHLPEFLLPFLGRDNAEVGIPS